MKKLMTVVPALLMIFPLTACNAKPAAQTAKVTEITSKDVVKLSNDSLDFTFPVNSESLKKKAA